MVALIKMAKQAVADRKGITALEYGVVAGLITVVIIGGMSGIGTKVAGYFTTLLTSLT